MTQPDVLIVGGGVIGAACAHALAQREVAVTVIAPGPRPGAATPAAGGMLAPFAEAEQEDPLLGLSVRARDLYNDLAPVLREETGIDIGLRTEGILQVAFSEEEASNLKGAIAWQRQSGFATEWLSQDEVRKLVPGIGPEAQGGALAPEDGGLEPMALRDALLRAAALNGATLVEDEQAEGLLIEEGRAQGVRTGSGERVAGSTMEHAGFATGTTEDGLRQVYRIMRRIYPALTGAPVLRTWAGLRPVTPDGRPLIGTDPHVPNLWYATGHGRNGILLAAMTGDILARLYVEEDLELDLSSLDPARFDTE
jgi:glycine/D-amino acid oxidase-like deaminating enzyme